MLFPAAATATHVVEFCNRISATEKPITVACQPMLGEPENECFVIVPEHASCHGGEQIIGWAIWERPGVFIEAEFHAVWRNPLGEFLCLTPRPRSFEAITFLLDRNRKYHGRQVDNIRHALVKDMDVVRFLFLAKRRMEILNTGDLADQHGYISLPKKLEREYFKVMKEMVRLENRLATRYPSHSAS